MDRITLSNLHGQIDSLKSTSIPQVKRYFRKQIVKCINECKLQAINMKKAVENGHSSKDNGTDLNEYEFGWGSDFDDDVDEEEDERESSDLQLESSGLGDGHALVQFGPAEVPVSQIIALNLEESPKRSRSANLEVSPRVAINSLIASVGGVRRPASEPPPPPLPKHPPPSLLEDCLLSTGSLTTASDDGYELMSISSGQPPEDEYLLPNSACRSTTTHSNYESIDYTCLENRTTCSSDTLSTSSNGSRVNLKSDGETNLSGQCDRPLPPIPVDMDELAHYSWFHEVERDRAERLLQQIAIDGAYLVRRSRRAGLSNPYSLTLYYHYRIFHLNIRKRPDCLYALGKEKHKEKTFSSVAELIKYHNEEPIFLTSKGQPAGKTRLIYTPSCLK